MTSWGTSWQWMATGKKKLKHRSGRAWGIFSQLKGWFHLISTYFYCKVHYIMCIKICRWNIFGGVPALLATIGVPALLATIYMYIYICIYIYYYYYCYYYYFIIIIYLYNTSTNAEMYERGGPPPQSGGISPMFWGLLAIANFFNFPTASSSM